MTHICVTEQLMCFFCVAPNPRRPDCMLSPMTRTFVKLISFKLIGHRNLSILSYLIITGINNVRLPCWRRVINSNEIRDPTIPMTRDLMLTCVVDWILQTNLQTKNFKQNRNVSFKKSSSVKISAILFMFQWVNQIFRKYCRQYHRKNFTLKPPLWQWTHLH